MEPGKDSTNMVGWNAGCGESYLSGAGSAGRKPTAARQQGAVLRLQALATLLVKAVLRNLDDHLFAVIPQEDIRHAVNAVTQILRDESASMAEPEEGSSCLGC
jgi:hypothetical protein